MGPEGFSAVILAAGKATRFKSSQPKVLHRLAGRPLGEYTIRTALAAGPEKAYLIVGREAEQVRRAFQHLPLQFIEQKEQLGTGHALQVAKPALLECPSPTVMVLVGDAPLLCPETLRALLAAHMKWRAAATVLTTRVENPHGYGRILRAPRNRIRAIVEQKRATPAQQKIKEISSGILCFSRGKLLENLGELSADNPQKEFLLTDLIGIFNRHRYKVAAFLAPNSTEVKGINDRLELAAVERIIRLQKTESLMRGGVTIVDPQATYIDADVEVGPDTVIEPGVTLGGQTRVGNACRLQAYTTIVDSTLGDRVMVRPCCFIAGCSIAADAVIGPFAHLRDGAEIAPEARIGNFVEVKKSRVGRATKALHLTYLGDATLGEGVNIGAGTVTCNYDGEKKNPTVIEDGVFIGSGSMLVAPVRIGQGAYVGAGSTITEDVPPHSLALGRTPQVNKEGWTEKRERGRKPPPPAKDAAPPAVSKFRPVGDVLVVDLVGRVTFGPSADELGRQVQAAIASGQKYLVISFQNADYVDSAGLGVLTAALISARRAGGDVKFANLSEKMMKLLAASNLHRAFEIHSTERDAIRSFATNPTP